MPHARGALCAGLILALTPGAAVHAQSLTIDRVWSRLADINGELGSVESAELSRDSQYVASGTKFDYSVRVFRTVDGHQVWSTAVPQEIERVAWLADGAHVAAVSEDFMLRVFNIATGETVFEYRHESGIDGLAVSNDGRFLATGQERNRDADVVGPARVFSTADWSLLQTLDHGHTINEVDFSSDDRFLATVGHPTVKIWDLETGEIAHEFEIVDTNNPEQSSNFINGKFSPDDRYFAAGATEGFIYLYDLEAGELVRRLNKTGQKHETISFTADGRHLFVAGHAMTIDFFAMEHLVNEDLENDSVPFAHRAPVTDHLEYMDINAEGTLLTTAHQDGTVQLWTVRSGEAGLNARRHQEVRAFQRASGGN